MAELYTFLVTTVAKLFTTGLATGVSHLFHIVITFLQQNFFGHPFIGATLGFFEAVGGIMLLVGLLKSIILSAEQSMHGEAPALGAKLMSFLKAYAMLLFCRPVVMFFHMFIINIVSLIASPFIPDFSDMEITMKDFNLLSGALSSILFAVVFAVMSIATVLMIFHVFKQYITLYVQVLTGYLYVYDIASGNDNVIGEWGRDVVSGRLTFGLQLMCYQVGMYLCAGAFSGNDYVSYLVGGVLLVGVCTIPSALKKWGNSVGGGGGGGIANLAYMASMMISRGKAATA